MAAAQDGSRADYAKLLVECQPIIRRVARRTGAHPDLVDDVVQDVLLTLHGARQTYDPSRSFVAWLSTIAQRRTIDAMRRFRRSSQREVHAPVEYELHADATADAEAAWRRTAQARELDGAVSGLSAGQRQAVELIALQGRSLAEASASTGRTKGALKVNFHRALETLKQRVSGSRDDG